MDNSVEELYNLLDFDTTFNLIIEEFDLFNCVHKQITYNLLLYTTKLKNTHPMD